jgi:hypothetical protein
MTSAVATQMIIYCGGLPAQGGLRATSCATREFGPVGYYSWQKITLVLRYYLASFYTRGLVRWGARILGVPSTYVVPIC